MTNKEAHLLKPLVAIFKSEAAEHIRAMAAGLHELSAISERTQQEPVVEAIFREAHSLKGAAWIVNQTEIQALCHTLESVFATWKNQQKQPTPELLTLLNQAVAALEHFLKTVGTERAPAEASRLTRYIHQIESLTLEDTSIDPPAPVDAKVFVAAGASVGRAPTGKGGLPEERFAFSDTVRISTAKLDSLLLQVEELVLAKLASGERVAELRALEAMLATWDKEWVKVRAAIRSLPQLYSPSVGGGQGAAADGRLMKFLEFAEWNKTLIESLKSKVVTATRAAERDYYTFGGMMDNLLHDMKQALMMPFSLLLEVFPRMASTLAQTQGKEVDVTISGADIEIDRRILEEIKDPLIHLLRNCVDHGIEQPEERLRKHKPSRGVMTISITQTRSTKVEIRVTDDGAGINVSKVRASAVQLGLLSAQAAESLPDHEASALIFHSGLSTNPVATSISGRGLGLAIVREKVERLGGVISLETQEDAGTTFHIVLPLTLATFRGILVRAQEHYFIFPTTHVAQVAGVNRQEVQTVNDRPMIRAQGQLTPLIPLEQILELAPKMNVHEERVPVVVVKSGEIGLALAVDEILGEQEVLMKRLGPQLLHVRNIVGATVLGTGQVVPILSVSDLIKSASKTSVRPVQSTVIPKKAPARRKSILVVEDSMTARTQLKNILELANYGVRTATNGVDALKILRAEAFDLVVSDVEMPLMNGLELTARIRADEKLTELPVILVTALDSHADRKRGIEAGANAYIIKGNFDQNNLLEMIRRLL